MLSGDENCWKFLSLRSTTRSTYRRIPRSLDDLISLSSGDLLQLYLVGGIFGSLLEISAVVGGSAKSCSSSY